MGAVVGITGVSGCLGQNLLAQLEVDPDVDAVVGIDIAPEPTVETSKLTFYQQSVTEPFFELFAKHQVTIGIHLAFALNPIRNRAEEQKVNLEGTRQFLAACGASDVETLCMLSSATVYGARADGPDINYEASATNATEAFPYAADKIRAEAICYDYIKDHPDVCLQIIRPCVIIGPNTNNYLTRMIERPVLFVPLGSDIPLQFVHEDDATRAIYKLVKLRKTGVFNLAADGALTLSQIAHLTERRCVRLPSFVLRLMAWIGWRFDLKWLSETPPGFIDYCVYPWLIAGMKLRMEAYFMFRYDGPAAFLDYCESRSNKGNDTLQLPPPPPPVEEVEVEVVDEVDPLDEPEPSFVPEPEPDTSESEPAESEPESESETETEPEAEAEAEAETETEAEAQTETEAEAQTESEPESEPELDSEAAPAAADEARG